MHPHAEIVYNYGKITKKRVSRHLFSLVFYIMNSECIRVCIYTLDCGIKYCCRSMDLLPTNLRKTELSLCVHMPVFRCCDHFLSPADPPRALPISIQRMILIGSVIAWIRRNKLRLRRAGSLMNASFQL